MRGLFKIKEKLYSQTFLHHYSIKIASKHLYLYKYIGFLEKEIKKDGIPMLDTGDNPDAPVPREMIDLEVCVSVFNAVNKKIFLVVFFFYLFIKAAWSDFLLITVSNNFP